MKNLKLYTSHSEYQEPTDFPNVSYCLEENEIHCSPVPDYSLMYLTFEVVQSGTITIVANNSSVYKKILYSIDNGNLWQELTTSDTEQNLGGVLSAGSKVIIKGNNSCYAKSGTLFSDYYNKFGGTAKVNIYGNIMSLIYGDNFINNNTLTSDYAFYSLFLNYSNLLSINNLIFPSLILTPHCYSYMFELCNNLISAKIKLPAITLANYCYYCMFYGCKKLTETPISTLSATTLVLDCYAFMFKNCSGLTSAPVLPATTLANDCYNQMFSGCTSLTTAPELPATTLVNSCYYGMFQDCTALTAAPVLPATTLTSSCYDNIFKGCSKLNYIKAMFTTTPGSTYTYDWLTGVSSTGTFVKNSTATWNVTGVYGIPTGWTVETASA